MCGVVWCGSTEFASVVWSVVQHFDDAEMYVVNIIDQGSVCVRVSASVSVSKCCIVSPKGVSYHTRCVEGDCVVRVW